MKDRKGFVSDQERYDKAMNKFVETHREAEAQRAKGIYPKEDYALWESLPMEEDDGDTVAVFIKEGKKFWPSVEGLPSYERTWRSRK
jgi:hypothetical protein